jgi:hypothetical protein
VKGDDGKPLVPSDPFGPYKMIGSRSFTKWLTAGGRAFAVDTVDNGAEGGNKCTSCHRIGSKNTCAAFAPQSIGMQLPSNLSAFAREDFKHTHWMPSAGSPGAPETTADWNADPHGFRADAERLLACCQDPGGAGCKRTPINDVPPPYARD